LALHFTQLYGLNFLRLSLIEDIPPYYLELVLNSIFVQLQIEQSVGGSIIKHWKPSQVQKTWIPRLLADREKEISALVQQSHAARREAKTLLEKAKRAVEIAIEEGEERAMLILVNSDHRSYSIRPSIPEISGHRSCGIRPPLSYDSANSRHLMSEV